MARDLNPTPRREYPRPPLHDDWALAWDMLVEDLDDASLYDEDGEIKSRHLASGAVTASALDLSIEPTWTGTHRFNDDVYVPNGDVGVHGDVSTETGDFVAVGGSVEAQAVTPKDRPVVDVTAYGADPDDAASSDTSAIQDAITAAQAIMGIVYFPPGDYLITSPIEIYSQMCLKGAGYGSRIRAGSSMDAVIANSDLAREDRVTIRDLWIDGNDNADIGIECKEVHRWLVEGVNVRNCVTSGVHIGRAWIGKIADCDIQDCGRGIESTYGGANNSVTVENVALGYNDTYAVYMDEGGGQNYRFRDCTIENVDVYVNNGRVTFKECYFEDSVFTVEGDSSGSPRSINDGSIVTVDSCSFHAGNDVLDIADAEVRFVDNTFTTRASGDETPIIRGAAKLAGNRNPFGQIGLDATSLLSLTGSTALDTEFTPSEGVFADDSDSDGLADGWVTSSSPSTSIVSGVTGNAQQVTFENGDKLEYTFGAVDSAGFYTIVFWFKTDDPTVNGPRFRTMSDTGSYSTVGSGGIRPDAEDTDWHVYSAQVEIGSATDLAGVSFYEDGSTATDYYFDSICVVPGIHYADELTPYDFV